MARAIADLLAAYDAELRGDAETRDALAVAQLGPLRLVTSRGGHGFVTYRDLAGADSRTIARWVHEVVLHYQRDRRIKRVEWKTRGHDRAPGLHEALLENGFAPGEPEAIMIGEARALAVEVTPPPGVTLRQIADEADVRAMCTMVAEAFDEPVSDDEVGALMHRLMLGDGMELWVAEDRGRIVSAGRVEPVPGSQFAGLWGGATTPEYRGRGIYRALTSARATSALRAGKTLMHSDSTAYSRPILERAGMVRVSTTTPYLWRC